MLSQSAPRRVLRRRQLQRESDLPVAHAQVANEVQIDDRLRGRVEADRRQGGANGSFVELAHRSSRVA